jgi:hypothetical protein
MCTKLGSEKGLGSRFSVLGYLGFVQTKCSALKRRRWLVQKCFFCQPPNTKASKAGRQFGISYPSATPKPLSRTSSQYASRQGHMFHLRPATKKATSVLDNIERGISANSDETGKTVGFLRYCFCPPPTGLTGRNVRGLSTVRTYVLQIYFGSSYKHCQHDLADH